MLQGQHTITLAPREQAASAGLVGAAACPAAARDRRLKDAHVDRRSAASRVVVSQAACLRRTLRRFTSAGSAQRFLSHRHRAPATRHHAAGTEADQAWAEVTGVARKGVAVTAPGPSQRMSFDRSHTMPTAVCDDRFASSSTRHCPVCHGDTAIQRAQDRDARACSPIGPATSMARNDSGRSGALASGSSWIAIGMICQCRGKRGQTSTVTNARHRRGRSCRTGSGCLRIAAIALAARGVARLGFPWDRRGKRRQTCGERITGAGSTG